MIIHGAPRTLKIGKSCGRQIAKLGRSIVTGCQRSQSIARAYTTDSVQVLRKFVNILNKCLTSNVKKGLGGTSTLTT